MTDVEYFKLIQTNSETSSTSGESSLFSKTLIIFDFDDTLFCTKYFDTFTLSYQDIFSCKVSLEEINPCLLRELKELESTIIELFMNLQQNYDIIIISNANMKWINNCLTHFLEELKEYINENNIKVYSAKNIFSNLNSDKKKETRKRESSGWKIKCFEKVIKDIYYEETENNILETAIDLNVLSIGDGEDEKKAVFKLNKNKFNFCQNLQSKFIRMIDYPSASSIIMQLEYLQNNMSEILHSNKNIYKMVIEIVNGTTQIKCIPKKKKNKNDKLNLLYDFKKKVNCEENKQSENEEDIFLFNNFNDFENDELANNRLFGYLESDEDMLRRNLFLGKKKFF